MEICIVNEFSNNNNNNNNNNNVTEKKVVLYEQITWIINVDVLVVFGNHRVNIKNSTRKSSIRIQNKKRKLKVSA